MEIIGGPLAELGGAIIKVDWRKQIAKVTVDIDGGLNVWLSYDCVEAIEDPARQNNAGDRHGRCGFSR